MTAAGGRSVIMSAKLISSTAISTLGAAALVLAIVAAPAYAAEPAEITTIAAAVEANPTLKSTLKAYGSPLFVPAADFRTDGLYPEAQFYSTAGYWKGDDLGGVYLVAPVWLPDNAEINAVWLFGVDNDDDCSTADMTLWLQRVDNYTGAVDGMAVVSTSGASTNMQTPHEGDPTNPVITYPDYAYWLTVRICSTDHELYGVMIFY
jgi:hypothetical protein